MFELDGQYRVFGMTAVENLFLTEYMPGADGDYVKVYLSALYHCQQGDESFDISALALELGMQEDRVEAALRYWERRRLLSRISDQPPRYRLHHMGERMLTGQDSAGGDRDFVAFSEALYALFSTRRKLRPSDIATAYEWVTELRLPQEVVLMLLTHCMDTRGASFSFKAAQSLAVAMREAEVRTTEEAEDYLSLSRQAHDGARAVLRRFNLRRLPTQDELNLYTKWRQDWGFTEDAILAACSETVKASSPSFGYLNGVLEGLRKRGAGGKASQVEQHLSRESSSMAGAAEVLKALGTRTSPAVVMKAYEALLEGAPHGMIVLAAQEVALRRGRFEDIEKQLKAWAQQGITNPDQALATRPQGKRDKSVSAQRYGQRDYTEDELSYGVEDMLKEALKHDEG